MHQALRRRTRVWHHVTPTLHRTSSCCCVAVLCVCRSSHVYVLFPCSVACISVFRRIVTCMRCICRRDAWLHVGACHAMRHVQPMRDANRAANKHACDMLIICCVRDVVNLLLLVLSAHAHLLSLVAPCLPHLLLLPRHRMSSLTCTPLSLLTSLLSAHAPMPISSSYSHIVRTLYGSMHMPSPCCCIASSHRHRHRMVMHSVSQHCYNIPWHMAV